MKYGFPYGLFLVLIICRDSGQVTLLDSKKMILYTWDEPRGVRKLFWKPYMGMDKPVEIPVDKVKLLVHFFPFT